MARPGGVAEEDDRRRLDEIEAWFEARGLLLVTNQSGRLWVAAVLRHDVRVGVGDVAGEGGTAGGRRVRLSKYEAEEGRKDVTIQGVPAEARAEGIPGEARIENLSPSGGHRPWWRVDPWVLHRPVDLPFETDATKLAVEYGWRLGFRRAGWPGARLPDGLAIG